MLSPLILLGCLSIVSASKMFTDQNRYLDVECRQLLREDGETKCLLLTLKRPKLTDDSKFYEAKRATRDKIRQILVDSYLNRIG
ncbi:hypothetical protein DICVIV_06514 [Dictyocaulus viviparus]|uniref:Uncharacterized protein n=1 Tax=Dictyocaulus viviparus TaxID=29172 RepID=A0A0D8XRY3_DICVI|nr:hypothetical protein DICVIV_06514 [Dictyocaulus viviparus]